MQLYSAVAALPGGGFVATWMSSNQDGDGQGIYGQRFTISALNAAPTAPAIRPATVACRAGRIQAASSAACG